MEAAYRDWGEIEPMPAEEARRRADGNYAPWADFRTFMDDSLADFFARLQSALEEVDPKAKLGISGTQDAVAGNGMDWWKLCHSLQKCFTATAGKHAILSPGIQPRHRHAGCAVFEQRLRAECRAGSGGFPVVGRVYECFGQTSLGLPNNFFPDLTLSETGSEAKRFLAEVRGGIWPLLRSIHRDGRRWPSFTPNPASRPTTSSTARSAAVEVPRCVGCFVARQRPAVRFRRVRAAPHSRLLGRGGLQGPHTARMLGAIG